MGSITESAETEVIWPVHLDQAVQGSVCYVANSRQLKFSQGWYGSPQMYVT